MPDLEPLQYLLLAAGGAVAAAVNAVAGGGSLISFPLLIAVGLKPLPANATNLVALLPGYLGGTVAYRRELGGQRARIKALGATSAVGAGVGTTLLLIAPASAFDTLAPFLVLLACGLLAAQPALSRRVGARRQGRTPDHHGLGLHAAIFAATVYGGYFGAGLGIMLLALLGSLLDDDLQRLNALKGLLGLVVGVVAATVVALFGPVDWGAAAAVAAGSLAGGHLGVGVARRLDESVLRWGVVVFGVAVATWLPVR